MKPISIAVGFDQREAVAYHVFCQSVIEHASVPVAFIPLSLASLNPYKEAHKDGSNTFIYTRFLVPYLNNFEGWSIYADGDMICRKDIVELWKLRDSQKAVLVSKHAYETKSQVKYFGNVNQNYPRKNWSSVILWNCSHPANRILTPEFVSTQPGSFLHRFSWLDNELIGDLPLEWNWLETEYPANDNARLVHYTLGTPCLKDYRESETAHEWFQMYLQSQQGMDS